MTDVEQLLADGNKLEDGGDFEGALQYYLKAAEASPDHHRVPLNIANAQRAAGRFDDATRTLREALARKPDHAAAHFNLGALLAAQGRLSEAESALRESLHIEPESAEALVMLANVLETGDRSVEAETALMHALEIRPDYAGATLNLGLLQMGESRYDEAEEAFARATQIDPTFASAHAALGALYLRTGRHASAQTHLAEARRLDSSAADVTSASLFALNFRSDVDVETIAREHKKTGAALARASGTPFTTWLGSRDMSRRLKIGYVSGDYRQHPIGLFMRPVLAMHDRDRFEIHCYSNHSADDDVTTALRQSVEHWHPIAGIDDRLVAALIHSDAIDILVDLSGHTERNRLGVFARRPAPVQVTWLGYLNTTGLPTIDYRISDAYTDPPGETEHLHTERLYRLPFSQWCYAPYYDLPEHPAPHPQQLDSIVFASFNQVAKITDACLDLWCRILLHVPRAELAVLDVPEGQSRKVLLDRLAARHVDSSRVRIHHRQGIVAYFNAISNVDIALDTFPYNGATTTLDTLWMGTPLVALRGDRGTARSSYSIMSSLQMPELIAQNAEEYVTLNVHLAEDATWRRTLRSSMRNRLLGSPLMNAGQFVADLEAGYRQMWETTNVRSSGR